MKTKILVQAGILLLLLFLEVSCEKDQDARLLQIYPKENNSIIYSESDIAFRFCILNQEGDPSTILKYGENFTLYFSFTNKMQDTIFVTTEFIDSNFFRIFNFIRNVDMGKPWTGIWCQFSLEPHIIILAPNKTKELKCPWILKEDNKPDYPLCMSESKEFLPSGEYFTNINLNFHFSEGASEYILNDTCLKINFKIE
jgi:hypothetical protein